MALLKQLSDIQQDDPFSVLPFKMNTITEV